MRSSFQRLVFLATSVLCLGTAAQAAADCPNGTLFPDFRCERHGRYPGFVAPMSMPYLFEDPFITTGVYAWGLWHEFPENGVGQGGDAEVVSLQARLAITERIGLVATQDGYTWLRTDNPLLDDDEGFMDLIAGIKISMIDDPEDNFILSTSLRYKTSQGTRSMLQGYGDGGWLPGLALAWGGSAGHVIADVGAYLPMDGDAETSFGFWNVHLDHPLTPKFVPFIEINGIHYIDDGNGQNTIELSGGSQITVSAAQTALRTGHFDLVDYGNFGSDEVSGQDYVTGAVGMRYLLGERVSLGLSYERPLTTTREITRQRATLSLAFEL